jgi:hypothetical protein
MRGSERWAPKQRRNSAPPMLKEHWPRREAIVGEAHRGEVLGGDRLQGDELAVLGPEGPRANNSFWGRATSAASIKAPEEKSVPYLSTTPT